jgi:hypothetical protein
MPSTRLKKTADHKLSTTLTYLEQQLNAIKASQQYLGGSSVVFSESSSGSTYDWNGTPSDSATTYLLVTITADTAPVLYSSLVTQLFVGTSTSWYRPSNFLADQAAGDIPINVSITDVPNAPGLGSDVNQCVISINGDNVRPAWLKLFVLALDTTTFTLAVL